MDFYNFNHAFVVLGMLCIVICPASSGRHEIVSLPVDDNSRHQSNTNRYWLRGFNGFHSTNQRRRANLIEHIKTNYELEQLEVEQVREDLLDFSNEGTYFDSRRIQNADPWIKNPLGKIKNDPPSRMKVFLHSSFYRNLVFAPFGSSFINPTYHDNGELDIEAVSGEDDNSNSLWSLEHLRTLLGFHIDERRILHGASRISSISPMVAAEPPTIGVAPLSAGPPSDNHQAPSRSPSQHFTTPFLQFAPPLVTALSPHRPSSILSPADMSNSPHFEQSGEKSGTTKAVVIAVVVTALSTLTLVGLCFCFYKKLTRNSHGSNEEKDGRPLLSSSIQNGSWSMKVLQDPSPGNLFNNESKVFNLGAPEFSNGTLHKSPLSVPGMADGMWLSSNRERFRALSLPSHLRKSRETPEIHPLPPLPKRQPSPLDSSDKGTFHSPYCPSAPSSLGTSQSPHSSISNKYCTSPPRTSQESMQIPSTLACPVSEDSLALPPSFHNPLSPAITPAAIPPPHLQCASPTLPPPTSNPLSLSKPLPAVPPMPPPHPPTQHPPIKSPPPPPPPTYQSRPPPPSAPTKGKYSQPPPPPLPAKSSQSPVPPLPPRPPSANLNSSKAGQSLPYFASSHLGPGVGADQYNATGEDGNPWPKLKPFHWDKVRASPDHSMVWDQIRAGSFQFNEEMIESLFGYNSTNKVKSETTRNSVFTSPGLNPRLLDPKKSQNIAILLRALNVTKEEVCDALFEGDGLSTELLETLVKMAPTKDEEEELKGYTGEISKLGPAERFLKAILDIPFAFKRFDAMLYRANLKEEVNYIKKSFETLEVACKELRYSRLFLKLLEAVLKMGNRMNVGTFRGGAQAFKLDTLLKLADVKGTDGKTTLLHFVVQEIVRAEGIRAERTAEKFGANAASNVLDSKVDCTDRENKSSEDKEDYYRTLGLRVLANLSIDLCNVKKAAAIDSDALTSSVSRLARGLVKLRTFLQTECPSYTKAENGRECIPQGNFYLSMTSFLHQAEEEISQIQSEEKRVFFLVKEITKYFHGDAAKEEAHPFRIFVIVRDFIGMLDKVCKEVGTMQKRIAPASSPQEPRSNSVNFSHSLFPTAFDRKSDSSDDESTSP